MNSLFTFKSIHFVMIAEEILKAASIDYHLVPTPESISTECGMSLELSTSLKNKVSSIPIESSQSKENIRRKGGAKVYARQKTKVNPVYEILRLSSKTGSRVPG